MKIKIKYLCTCGEWSSSIFDVDKFGRTEVQTQNVIDMGYDPELITHGVCRVCGRLPIDITVVEG